MIFVCKQWKTWTRQPLSPSVNLYITELQVLFGGHGTMEVQCWTSQPVDPLVNFYIMELWVLFVEHETIEAQFWARQLENLRSKKWLSMFRFPPIFISTAWPTSCPFHILQNFWNASFWIRGFFFEIRYFTSFYNFL